MHIPLSQVLARKFVAVLPADATVMTVNGQILHAETKTTHNSFGKMRVNSRLIEDGAEVENNLSENISHLEGETLGATRGVGEVKFKFNESLSKLMSWLINGRVWFSTYMIIKGYVYYFPVLPHFSFSKR